MDRLLIGGKYQTQHTGGYKRYPKPRRTRQTGQDKEMARVEIFFVWGTKVSTSDMNACSHLSRLVPHAPAYYAPVCVSRKNWTIRWLCVRRPCPAACLLAHFRRRRVDDLPGIDPVPPAPGEIIRKKREGKKKQIQRRTWQPVFANWQLITSANGYFFSHFSSGMKRKHGRRVDWLHSQFSQNERKVIKDSTESR